MGRFGGREKWGRGTRDVFLSYSGDREYVVYFCFLVFSVRWCYCYREEVFLFYIWSIYGGDVEKIFGRGRLNYIMKVSFLYKEVGRKVS